MNNYDKKLFDDIQNRLNLLYDDRFDVILEFYFNKWELYFIEVNNKMFKQNIVIAQFIHGEKEILEMILFLTVNNIYEKNVKPIIKYLSKKSNKQNLKTLILDFECKIMVFLMENGIYSTTLSLSKTANFQ